MLVHEADEHDEGVPGVLAGVARVVRVHPLAQEELSLFEEAWRKERICKKKCVPKDSKQALFLHPIENYQEMTRITLNE